MEDVGWDVFVVMATGELDGRCVLGDMEVMGVNYEGGHELEP